MTTSRIVRGTKIRIFVCFCAIVIILGLIACYNNTISQLDETQKAVALCHQQQENLSTQLQGEEMKILPIQFSIYFWPENLCNVIVLQMFIT